MTEKPKKRKKTRTVILHKVHHIEVNCEPNDSVDIRCGGQPMLGFDFYVDINENVKEYIEFIKKTLAKHGLPWQSIFRGKTEIETKKTWTKRMIATEIKNDKNIRKMC